MAKFPEMVRVDYKRSKRAGLYAAVSDDLPGLMAVANTLDEVDLRIPAAIAQIIEAQYGVRVEVTLRDADGDDDDFTSLSESRFMELRAA